MAQTQRRSFFGPPTTLQPPLGHNPQDHLLSHPLPLGPADADADAVFLSLALKLISRGPESRLNHSTQVEAAGSRLVAGGASAAPVSGPPPRTPARSCQERAKQKQRSPKQLRMPEPSSDGALLQVAQKLTQEE